MEQTLVLDVVKVTEAAAIAAARHMGEGDTTRADQAAVTAMREMLADLPIHGRVVIGEGEQMGRIADSVETALKLGAGVVLVSVMDGEELLFSEHFACVHCGISIGEIAPRTFSFNSPHGACPACTGLGPDVCHGKGLFIRCLVDVHLARHSHFPGGSEH